MMMGVAAAMWFIAMSAYQSLAHLLKVCIIASHMPVQVAMMMHVFIFKSATSTISFIPSSSVTLDPTLLVSPSATSVIVSHEVSATSMFLSPSILASSSIPVESTSAYLTIDTISKSAIVITKQTSVITEILSMTTETTLVMATPLESQSVLLNQSSPTSATQNKICKL